MRTPTSDERAALARLRALVGDDWILDFTDRVMAGIRGAERQREAAARVRQAIEWRAIPVRPAGLTRVVPGLPRPAGLVTWRERVAAMALPFGWTAEREEGRHAYRVGPVWYLVPRRWWIMRWWALEPLLRLGLLELEEHDYWRNARPRGWARLQRWLAWARADFRARMPR